MTKPNSIQSIAVGLAISALMLACVCLPCLAQSGSIVTVRPADELPSNVLLLIDGKVVAVESLQLMRSQQVMIWIRDLEKLGWGAVESSVDDRVTFKGKGVTLTFIKKQDVALVNSLAVKLPINTYSRNGNLMVPLSFVAKALGFDYQCVDRPVASIITAPPETENKTPNTIRGKVLYNGTAVTGVTIRAVDPSFRVIKDAAVTTDSRGEYRIDGLPDGTYMAYAYTGDNPTFFNRATAPMAVSGGKTAQLEPLVLGQILDPTSPKPNSQTKPDAKKRVSFSWGRCEGAVSYRLVITRRGSDTVIIEANSAKPSVTVPVDRLAKGTVYEAKVTATNAAGEFLGGTAGAGGAPWAFLIK